MKIIHQIQMKVLQHLIQRSIVLPIVSLSTKTSKGISQYFYSGSCSKVPAMRSDFGILHSNGNFPKFFGASNFQSLQVTALYIKTLSLIFSSLPRQCSFPVTVALYCSNVNPNTGLSTTFTE